MINGHFLYVNFFFIYNDYDEGDDDDDMLVCFGTRPETQFLFIKRNDLLEYPFNANHWIEIEIETCYLKLQLFRFFLLRFYIFVPFACLSLLLAFSLCINSNKSNQLNCVILSNLHIRLTTWLPPSLNQFQYVWMYFCVPSWLAQFKSTEFDARFGSVLVFIFFAKVNK